MKTHESQESPRQEARRNAVRSHAASNDYLGYCLACGGEADRCEPDARRYPCGESRVYGTEELLMMGRIVIVGSAS